jgi:hypothetical protein
MPASLRGPEIQLNLDLSITGVINRRTRALSNNLRTGLVLRYTYFVAARLAKTRQSHRQMHHCAVHWRAATEHG